MDLRITQDINLWNDHTFIVYLDVLNLHNLLSDKHGVVKEYSFNNSRQILVNGVDADGRVNITGVDPDDSLQVLNFDCPMILLILLQLDHHFLLKLGSLNPHHN